MTIRQGTINEMLFLWYKFNTTDFFVENLKSGNAEFWLVELECGIAGEIYFFKELADHDFADGVSTAYLYGFLIAEGSRGKGIGTQLLTRVLQRIRELGFRYATIGVEPCEPGNVRLYQRMGFTEKIKTCFHNLCDVDENRDPAPYPEYWLLRKTFHAFHSDK